MQIVTDSGTDLFLTPDQLEDMRVHVIPLVVTLDGKSYQEKVNIETEEFYQLLSASENLPVTSQPSAGTFAETYRKLALEDPEILSIHISSGLSGTVNAAKAGASQVPEANVTTVDTKTLSAAAGWQVEAALRGVKAGWSKEQILDLISRISDASDSLYTLNELKYLIHGGRISHMKGLIASLLNIKPIIGVEKVHGKYVQKGQARSFKGAVQGLVDVISRQHEPGTAMRVQVLYSFNPEGAAMLHEEIDKRFQCTWLPVGPMSLVLGAHTGPSMVGAAYATLDTFSKMP
jgi:DegV family protein with EDD domain